MFATVAAPSLSCVRGIVVRARLVLDDRARPAWTPQITAAQVSESSKRCWVHLVYEGRWDGYDRGARSFEFDASVFDAVVANFARQANPVVFDFEHGTEYAPPGEPIPAAGWVHAVAREGDSLYAYVEWTDRAASMIEAGEYRFCSVVVDFESVDRKTGEEIGPRLISVALTNTPFIDGQQPIRLSMSGRASTSSPIRHGALMPKKIRVQLADGAKSLLLQVAALLKIDLADGDDLYFKVMDALGALQQAAKVEDMLATAPATPGAPAMGERRIGLGHVVALAATSPKLSSIVLSEDASKVSREQLLSALDQLDGDSFDVGQLTALIEALVKMNEAMQPSSGSSSSSGASGSNASTASTATASDGGAGADKVTAAASTPVVPPISADTVTPGTAPSDSPQAAQPTPEQAVQVAQALMAATRLSDAAQLLAFIDANRDALGAMASSAPMDGSTAEDPNNPILRDRGVRAILAQLSGLSAEVSTLRAYKAKHDEEERVRVEAERKKAAADFAEQLVLSGKILDTARSEFVALHLENPKRATALAATLAPVVRTERIAGSDPRPNAGARAARTPKLKDASADEVARVIESMDEETRASFVALRATKLWSDAECAEKAAAAVASRYESRESA